MNTIKHDEHMNKKMHELMESAKMEKLEHAIHSHDHHMNTMHQANKMHNVMSVKELEKRLQ